ncbi:MAG: helix-hairpin-helix domain-containing protein [Pyrinomonadaceae bacterium]
MIQDSRATRRLLPPVILLLALLTGAACVKLPRKYVQNAAVEGAGAPLVDINTASPEQLESLPGIGRSLAARIIAHRERYGRFRRVEHLMMVRGIGERRFRRMRAAIKAE